MDEKAVEAAGAKPIEPELARIAAIKTPADLQAEVARLQSQGVRVLFGFGSEQDRKNSDEVIASLRQGGLGLPDRDYYLKDDARSKQIREKYAAHVARDARACSATTRPAPRPRPRRSLALETELAKISMSRVEQRNPDNTYHRIATAELAKLAPDFDWPAYFRLQRGAGDRQPQRGAAGVHPRARRAARAGPARASGRRTCAGTS